MKQAVLLPSCSAAFGLFLALSTLDGCSATNTGQTANDGGGGGLGQGGDGAGNLFGGNGQGEGGGPLQVEPKCEGVDPAIDNDADGWTGAAGDCNDCTDKMNPGAQDYPGNSIDEDCNGGLDDNPVLCDANIGVESGDPMDGARAMGLCKVAEGDRWGVVSALYITADGLGLSGYDFQGLGKGILAGFGPAVQPQEGQKLLAISSGAGRQPNDPGYQSPSGYDKGYTTGSPPGYPKESPACSDVLTGQPHDSAGLRLQIRTPTNAKSLSFNLNFYTYEFPNWICTEYNDFFVAMLSPLLAGQPDGNISYDANGNTISVNAGFLQVCHPQTANNGQFYDCPLGPGQLLGTGFDTDIFDFPTDNSAGTGWLQTTAPVADPGGIITIDFAVWDSGDGILDSTTLIDNFAFSVEGAPTETQPVPEPK